MLLAGACSGNGVRDASVDVHLGRDVGGERGHDAEIDDADLEDSVDADETEDPRWEEFLSRRENHLRALSEPIVECVGRSDTGHPAFHGCYDWHSAVHGCWALLALSRATGDRGFADVVDRILTSEAAAGELAQIESGSLTRQELPYGYAWFLHLARERALAGQDDLEAMARVVAEALAEHLEGLSSRQIDEALLSDDYDNLSWEVYSLWLHAERVGDEERSRWLEAFVRDEVVPRESLCPLSSSQERIQDFFPPCLHRALLITTVLSPEESRAWVEANVPRTLELHPLTTITGAHPAGLSFSRSWGLWALYRASGERRFRDLYIDHLETHLAMPEYWAENYDYYSHWVPQFGVFGIAMSLD